MTTMLAKPISLLAELEPIPPLENGDNLDRVEFERRYEAMPHIKKAELIEGVVYMPSPVSHIKHGRPHSLMSGWLGLYCAGTEGVDSGLESSVRLDTENEPQPDVSLLILPEFGGQSVISEDDFIEGAPELIVEVSSSSASIDMHGKLRAYRLHGVLEYIVWLVRQKEIRWFVLRDGDYEPLQPDANGVYHSETFPGLVLDVAAMLAGDRRRIFAVQREALNTAEHAAFVTKLAEAGAKSS